MKFYSLMAAFVLFCSSALFAQDLRRHDPDLTVSSASIADINCDLCGCYLGPDPNYNFNTAGIRYKLRHFSGDHSDDHRGNEVDHSDHSHESEETYNTFDLWGRYYFSPKLQAVGILPYSQNEAGDETYSGFGDMQLQAKYQLFNTEVDGSTRFRNRLFLGGGLKIPTGVFNLENDSGEVIAHFQPGTGSFDFLLLGSYFAKASGAGFVFDAAYKINTKNSNDYRFGNQLNLNGVFSYDIEVDKVTVIPYAGLYYEYAPEDESNSVKDPDSGGSALFGNFGIDVTAGMVALKINYQTPVSQSLNGDQPLNDYRLIAGFSYSFGF